MRVESLAVIQKPNRFFFLYTENLQLYSWNKDEDEHQNSRLFQVINAARSIPVTFSSIMLDTVNWSPRITNSVLRANLWCSWPELWYMSSYMLWQCIKNQGFFCLTQLSVTINISRFGLPVTSWIWRYIVLCISFLILLHIGHAFQIIKF